MNFAFLTGFCKRYKTRQLRGIMRGYRILQSRNELGRVRKVKREFTRIAVTSIYQGSPFFFGASAAYAGRMAMQYMITQRARVRFHRILCYSIGTGNSRFVYALPPQFINVLAENGFNVSRWRSSAKWKIDVFLMWCLGIITMLEIAWNGLVKTFSPDRIAERYVFFSGLKNVNLPRFDKYGKSYDVVSWYDGWSGAAPDLSAYYHTVQGVLPVLVSGKITRSVGNAYPPIQDFSSLARFAGWSVGAALLSVIDMIRGNWQQAFMLAEAAKAKVVSYTRSDRLAVDYMIDNSDTIYRPAWTYEAESKGSRIISYYYSTSEEFKLPWGYEPNSLYWALMTWPVYLVWDQYHYQLIRDCVGNGPSILVVGSVWSSSSPDHIGEWPERSVAGFDIQPVRDSFHFGFSTLNDLGYNNAKVACTFVSDIAEVLSRYNVAFVHKRKRRIGKDIHKTYKRAVERLEKEHQLVAVEPQASPVQVIGSCSAVISMPFTSTGIIGHEMGKPSVYYDPSGVIQKDDKGAHGLPVLTGKAELEAWVREVFSEKGMPAGISNEVSAQS